MKKYIAPITIVIGVLVVGTYYVSSNKEVLTSQFIDSSTTTDELEQERVPTREICVGEFCDGSGIDTGMPQDFTVVQIPLIKQGGNVGCDAGIFFAPHVVEPKTSAVLDATYRVLFDLKPTPQIKTDTFGNTVGAYTGLKYDSVSISNGTAKLQLTGNMGGPGHCAEPELRAQIDQAAFQFDSVKKIEVYLNGTLFDWCMTSDADPSEDHCDTKPRYWIDIK